MPHVEFKLAEHHSGQIVEIWWHGTMIGQVVAGDGPALRVVSRFPVTPLNEYGFPHVLSVRIE